MNVILPENATLELRVGNGHLEPMRWAWLGVAALAAEPAHLADGQPQHAEILQRFLDVVEPVRLHDRGDQLHGRTSCTRARSAHRRRWPFPRRVPIISRPLRLRGPRSPGGGTQVPTLASRRVSAALRVRMTHPRIPTARETHGQAQRPFRWRSLCIGGPPLTAVERVQLRPTPHRTDAPGRDTPPPGCPPAGRRRAPRVPALNPRPSRPGVPLLSDLRDRQPPPRHLRRPPPLRPDLRDRRPPLRPDLRDRRARPPPLSFCALRPPRRSGLGSMRARGAHRR